MSTLVRLLALSALCALVAIPAWSSDRVDDDDETAGVVIIAELCARRLTPSPTTSANAPITPSW